MISTRQGCCYESIQGDDGASVIDEFGDRSQRWERLYRRRGLSEKEKAKTLLLAVALRAKSFDNDLNPTRAIAHRPE